MTLTAPEAIGRWHFLGCWRSASTSCRSLKQYIELDIKQNEPNTTSVGQKYSPLSRLLLKNTGAKTNVFLSHCNGRSSWIYDSIFISVQRYSFCIRITNFECNLFPKSANMMTWGNKTSLVLSFSTGDAIDRIFATSNNCYDYSGKFPERTTVYVTTRLKRLSFLPVNIRNSKHQ